MTGSKESIPSTIPLLIIGGGPAGYGAAIYGARAFLNPVLIQGPQPGGQLTITTDVENYPGFSSIQGPELMEAMARQAQLFGTQIVQDTIVDIDFSGSPLICHGQKQVYQAQSVIIATGAYAKWLGIPGEKEFQGFGVSACATCDGFFFKKKTVAVVGGGNTAAEEALFLSHLAEKVYLIHRRDQLRAEKILQGRLEAQKNVTFVWNTVVESCFGAPEPHNRKLGGIILKNVQTHETHPLKVDGLFVAIGHSPNTKPFQNKLPMDTEGYLVCSPTPFTTIPGVFAAGDVQDRIYRQAVTAAGQGCMAALEAERFLSGLPPS
jgi:thioredoxin reductase (NADPH)